ncbi:protein-L-isoaspartate(D-aspartate) O-methyltransferase [Kaustia mangrovi]|uniref:Protein-L-isoaspartate O-methyltransferase n=1 Tax=Kaustia mangrovi TaxID=2593653 RepID=A0A7S8C1Q1_9HYPH|nr:protein-L-isoaspartate(D-aspartate) O-methyltransferase [Kaustia mangrovi]QPC41677.1 protein-L-isoaspartate(D-aspartate) O-methyltransferase [Kaustia mangrovi]
MSPARAGRGDGGDKRGIQLLMHLRNQGIRDTNVLEAIETVPRALFVPEAFADQTYADQALPIACGQTISQPFIVAFMTQSLRLTDRMKVLEIGTGSGYQTAILAHLARRVYTIERYRQLLREAEKRFKTLKLNNVVTMLGDGAKGWPAQAPFDRIIVTAAARGVPQDLVDQLQIGGIMVLPVEIAPGEQELQRIVRTDDGITRETLLPVRFVPLVEGVAKDG